MVRMQGDLGKPPEKRLNYKHCFDALFRVCTIQLDYQTRTKSNPLNNNTDVARRRPVVDASRSWAERHPCRAHELKSARLVSPAPFISEYLSHQGRIS